jgi:hypothetical protein
MSGLTLINILSEYKIMQQGRPSSLCSACNPKYGRRPECTTCRGLEERLKLLLLTKAVLPAIIEGAKDVPRSSE